MEIFAIFVGMGSLQLISAKDIKYLKQMNQIMLTLVVTAHIKKSLNN